MSRDYRDAAQLREAEVAALERIADALERIAEGQAMRVDVVPPAWPDGTILSTTRMCGDG